MPQDERRWKLKNLSCGVVFVDVERSDRMECRASGTTTSHRESGRFLDLRETRTVFQMIPLYLSTCPLPNRVVGCGFACCYASLRQVFLEFL